MLLFARKPAGSRTEDKDASSLGRRAGRYTALPFGTFLALAGASAIFFGRQVVDLYLGLRGWP